MGVVYLGTRIGDSAQVAIKTIRPAAVNSSRATQRFLREAGILARLRHPHIVSYHEMGPSGDLLFFVMDYVDGVSAVEILKQQGPLPIDRAVGLVCQALEGLHYAHQEGFVHRDVKPSNLLVSRDGDREICRLADFGLARAYGASSLAGLR
jgi:serine/threonine protein kinase